MGILALFSFHLAIASITLTPVERAINRQVCFEAFWENNDNIRLGKTIKMVARQDGNTTYVWSNDFSIDPGVRQSVYFFKVVSEGNQSLVGDQLGFNTDLMRDTPLYKQKMKEVFASGAVSFKLDLPSNCTPRFLPDNQLKALMLSDIKRSLMDDLIKRNNSGMDYPDHIELIIANFNVGDRRTYAFIPSRNEVFAITLYDPDNPFNNIGIRLGGFPTLDESGTEYASELIPKIIKYGRIFWIPK